MVNTPLFLEGPWRHVAHYYGDTIRQLFIAGAALMLLGAPFYANSLKTELPFEIIGALVLIALAALTNPHSKMIAAADAVAAGVGLLIYETWALYDYESSTWAQFILRELIAIIFLAAFYFSMKTLRAMLLHKIGKEEERGEFEEPQAPVAIEEEEVDDQQHRATGHTGMRDD